VHIRKTIIVKNRPEHHNFMMVREKYSGTYTIWLGNDKSREIYVLCPEK